MHFCRILMRQTWPIYAVVVWYGQKSVLWLYIRRFSPKLKTNSIFETDKVFLQMSMKFYELLFWSLTTCYTVISLKRLSGRRSGSQKYLYYSVNAFYLGLELFPVDSTRAKPGVGLPCFFKNAVSWSGFALGLPKIESNIYSFTKLRCADTRIGVVTYYTKSGLLRLVWSRPSTIALRISLHDIVSHFMSVAKFPEFPRNQFVFVEMAPDKPQIRTHPRARSGAQKCAVCLCVADKK